VFNALAVVSGAICVLVIALWLRSAQAAESVSYTAPDGSLRIDLQSINCRLEFIWTSQWMTGGTMKTGMRWHRREVLDGKALEMFRFNWRRIGFDVSHRQFNATTFGYDKRRCSIPYWFLVVMSCTLPWLWIADVRAKTRHSRLCICHDCGYDLRATPDRCPECGAVPAGKVPSPGVSGRGLG